MQKKKMIILDFYFRRREGAVELSILKVKMAKDLKIRDPSMWANRPYAMWGK